jgi:hypothetical protein
MVRQSVTVPPRKKGLKPAWQVKIAAALRYWPLEQRCGFDKGSISVSERVLGGSGSHPRPLLSISYGPLVPCQGTGLFYLAATSPRKSQSSHLVRIYEIGCSYKMKCEPSIIWIVGHFRDSVSEECPLDHNDNESTDSWSLKAPAFCQCLGTHLAHKLLGNPSKTAIFD